MKPKKSTLRVFQCLTALLAVAALLLGQVSLRLYRELRDGLAWEVEDDIVDLHYAVKSYLNAAGEQREVLSLSQVQRSAAVLSTRLDTVAQYSFPFHESTALGLDRDQLGELQGFFFALETYLDDMSETPADPALLDTLRGIRILLEGYVIGRDPADYAALLRQAGEDPETVNVTFWGNQDK